MISPVSTDHHGSPGLPEGVRAESHTERDDSQNASQGWLGKAAVF